MMRFSLASFTASGSDHAVNQDAFALFSADTLLGQVALAVVADGLGGLSFGEVASATVVRAFESWFRAELPLVIEAVGSNERAFAQAVRGQLAGLLQQQNVLMLRYAAARDTHMGTTCTAFLAFRGRYLAVHVGDSRLCVVGEAGFQQLSTDQTFVASQLAAGAISADQAAVHPERGALLQCVGATPLLEPAFYEGTLLPRATYLLMSDGFCRMLTTAEVELVLSPEALDAATAEGHSLDWCAHQALERLAAVIAARGERDDMTALALCVQGGDQAR